MLSRWRLALLLKLLKESDFEESSAASTPNQSNKPSSDKQKTNNNKFYSKKISGSSNPADRPKKIWLAKWGLAAGVVVIVLYSIFGYGAATFIEVESVSCNNKKLKITPRNGSDYTLQEFKKESTLGYANKIGFFGGEDIFDIYLYTENYKKISFRVSKSKAQTKDKGENWVYKVSSGATYSKPISCCEKDQNCCCGKNGTCTCNNGTAGTCNCNGQANDCCACCCFMQWIDTAILNMENPGKITASSVFFSVLPSLLYLTVFLFLIRSAMKGQSMGGIYGQGGLFKMGQSISKTTKSNITFEDVAGIKEEKAELEEIVDYLKNPAKYNAMGARTPKGVILYGPPGTGKTLLAKAVSGEAEVPFIEAAGSTFDDMFVGVGAKRVRELFAKAKKLAPCIIFIDEIDAVAGKRGNKYMGGGGGGIHDQTINQLLSEMDGFNTMTGIVIMAATNRLDSIDEAILRPGRFDRHIQINLPNISERVDILKVHARNKNLSSSIDLEDVARKTPGFSGAQLENVLNEATLLAVREDKKVIDKNHIDEAIDRVMAGPAKKSNKFSDMERRQIAYHEAGHAVAGIYSKEGEVVEKITIIPRGQAGGYMLSTPKKQETFLKRKDELLATVTTTLAGRASEEIFFGIDKISSGASNDLFKVTNLVRTMVTKLGMSEKLGLQQYEPSEGMVNPYKDSYSEKSSYAIDLEIEKIIEEQYKVAKQIIEEHKEELILIVECLLLIETIDRNQINFIHEHKKLPKEAAQVKAKLLKEGKELDLSPNGATLFIETIDV
ncbi:ATP-dependent zinc metalloprotease FtsH [Candidatus Mycoplasma haematohominis]|uniref:ATP-dependent zinc metalloprotease FtsH n=1 Tax=Candidatus Mycoplasma haematohominis TaxID=1494318 RepID=UPI001C0A67AB